MTIRPFIVAALAAVGLALVVPACAGGDVSGSQARQLVGAGARLVDVRTPDEFAAGHLPGAINVPLAELGQRMVELEPKDGALVLYCRSGNRSGQAKAQLERAGFTTLHDLGPMSAW